MPLGEAMARSLLVNKLQTRQPVVAEGMALSDLEEEMGGPGVIVNKLTAGGVEVVRYRWGAGDATVKGDVLVKWKPSGG